MNTAQWLNDLFSSIDAGDSDKFSEFLAEDAQFRFANAPAVEGRAAIREAVAGFFGAIRSLSHTLEEHWAQGESVICRGTVNYVRHDGSELNVPFANIFRMEGGLIRDYLIYVDASALFAQ